MGYKTTCPMCSGKNFYITPENGVGYCFNCGHTTHENEHKKALTRYHDVAAIREQYAELAHYYHSCLDTTALRYLEDRGIQEETIKNSVIGFCPDERHVLYQGELAQSSGVATKECYAWLAGRIVFPYWHKGICTDLRGRTITEDRRKYLSLRNSGFFRGADYPYRADDMYDNDTLVLTEGEIKTHASQYAGFPTIGLPGIMSLKPSIIQDKRYIVCFDSQIDNEKTHRAICRIGELFPSVSVATLPLLDGAEKEDIDSYILKYGISAYQRVINRALPFHTWRNLIKY